MHKEVKEVRRRLRKIGLIVEPAGKHLGVYTPEGKYVCPLNSSPSDVRWRKNFNRDLRVRGLLPKGQFV